MSNGDYREKIEEHRQSIELEDQQSSRMSRSRQKVKKKKKNRKNPLLNILLFVLLGIPFALLIYVSFFYTPADTDIAEVEENGSIVEVQTNNTVSASSKETEEPKIEQTDDSTSTSHVSTNDKETAVAKQVEEEAKKAEQAKLEQEQLAKQQEEQKEKESGGTTHTVQPNENLFRIALKYYNDSSGVDKIMEANNLSSNSISVGQTLIIP